MATLPENGWTTVSPEMQRRQFWARFSAELGIARRGKSSSQRKRLDWLEKFVLGRYASLWQFHKQRIAVSKGEIAFKTPMTDEGPSAGVTPLQEFNRSAAVLFIAWAQWDKEVKPADDDLMTVYPEVSFAGRYARCYALLWREVVFEHWSKHLKRHRNPGLTVSLPNCDRGWFYYRARRWTDANGAEGSGGTDEDCTADDLAAVNEAVRAIPDLQFADDIAISPAAPIGPQGDGGTGALVDDGANRTLVNAAPAATPQDDLDHLEKVLARLPEAAIPPAPVAVTPVPPATPSSGGKSVDVRANETPVDGPISQGVFHFNGKKVDNVQPAPWRLLEFLWGKTEADVRDAYRYAVNDDNKEATEPAVNSMIRKANVALEAVGYMRRLSKPKNVAKIIWG